LTKRNGRKTQFGKVLAKTGQIFVSKGLTGRDQRFFEADKLYPVFNGQRARQRRLTLCGKRL